MLINRSNLATMYAAFSAVFAKALADAALKTNFAAMLATEFPSNTKTQDYGFLGAMPKMREWIGDRQHSNLAAYHYTLTNKDYEATIDVPRNDIEDDSYGMFSPMFAALAAAAAQHPDELLCSVIEAGISELCYDGQYFFDTDHPSFTTAGAATTASNYAASSGSPWYLLDLSKPLKPFILQRRKQLELVRKDNPNDDNVFERKIFSYGVDDRKNVGYGLWQLAYCCSDTLSTTTFATGRAAMMALCDDKGRRLGVKPTHILYPPSLHKTAKALFKAEFLSSGASNPDNGEVELIECPLLTL